MARSYFMFVNSVMISSKFHYSFMICGGRESFTSASILSEEFAHSGGQELYILKAPHENASWFEQ